MPKTKRHKGYLCHVCHSKTVIIWTRSRTPTVLARRRECCNPVCQIRFTTLERVLISQQAK
jgi:transcriptional regulator NrdR family protein